jgi:hypothetical protein
MGREEQKGEESKEGMSQEGYINNLLQEALKEIQILDTQTLEEALSKLQEELERRK